MGTPSGLSERHQRFADEYLKDGNAGRAYQRAGYKANPAAADVGASRLLRNPKIATYLASQQKELRRQAGVTHQQVIAGLLREAELHGKESSHSARVSAWGTLARVLGMFNDQTTVNMGTVGPDWRFLLRKSGPPDDAAT